MNEDEFQFSTESVAGALENRAGTLREMARELVRQAEHLESHARNLVRNMQRPTA